MHVLKTITFAYDTREDRVLAAINGGSPQAWSCWLTRRLALALLERAPEFIVSTSPLVQRAASEVRSEVAAFERAAAITQTSKAMSPTPTAVVESAAPAAELAERVTLTHQGDNFHLELRGMTGGGVDGILSRAELQRMLQMLQHETAKAGWMTAPAVAPAATAADPSAKPIRH